MFKFRKVASVLASTAMLSSTVALAAAANYPAPFVSGGNHDVAVVWGSSAQLSDLAAVVDVVSDLQVKLAQQTATSGGSTEGSVSGEAAPLFTGGTKLYINDSLNAVKTILTKTEMPTLLADESFSGNVESTYTQTISMGSYPRITFEKQPKSSDDPDYGVKLSTSTNSYLYNASITFNKAINFTHSDSKGEELSLFGQTFTVSSDTDDTNLVLLKSAEKVSLDSDNPTAEVTVGGKTYTVELVSASDTSATIKVTDDAGNSQTKQVNENDSKKVQGVTVAVTTADETNLKLSASVIIGAEKVTLANGDAVTVGEEATTVDGTKVTFSNAVLGAGINKITVTATAPDSDSDAIKSGQTFVDPVFGSFKVDFSGINVPADGDAREEITVSPNSDDKVQVSLTDHTGNEKAIVFAKNFTAKMEMSVDDDGRNLTVMESQALHYQDYVVVGNEDEGHLLKLSSVKNASTGYNNDYVKFTDAFTGDTIETTWTADGSGSATVGGKPYSVTLSGNHNNASEEYTVRLDYPDSSGTGSAVIYPTIETSKGAKLAFYEPILSLNFSNWNGAGGALTQLKFPDGDGYTDVTVSVGGDLNVTVGGTVIGNGTASTTATVGPLTYNFTSAGSARANIYLVTPAGGSTSGNIVQPALVIFEEKDDNNDYQAVVVTLEAGATGDDGMGVEDVVRTWGGDASEWESTLASDSKVTKESDLYGTIATVDSSDSDQKEATISYPDEQVYAQIYVAGQDASITPGTTTGGTVKVLGDVSVSDAEASSVSTKNLIVVGGSCVNTVAAQLLGGTGPICGSDFTTKTGVESGQFLIQTFERTGGKVATLVAGYNAGDTTNAARALTTQTVDTTAGKKYTGTTATSITLVSSTNSTA